METFSGILGNKPALRLLDNALTSGEAAHAYLFYGPPGIGKRTVAYRFGATLVSSGDKGAEDRALRGLHPDLLEVEPNGQFTTIGQVREIVRLAASRPFEGARRVLILHADTLNVQAANALLKTLEEPEGGAVFVLLATSREGVLPTIASRTQEVRFDPVPKGEIVSFLRDRGHTEGEARLAGSLGRSSVGLALRHAEEDEFKELREAVSDAVLSFGISFEERHDTVGKIVARAENVGNAREKAYLADRDADEGADRRVKESAKRIGRAARDGAAVETLELSMLLYRDAAVVAEGVPEIVTNVDKIDELRALVADYPEADWVGAAHAFREARESLAYNVSPEAILEVALSRARRKILGTLPSGSSPG